MKIAALRFAPRFLTALAILPAIAHAHPGHDGHELTWDFGHLAAHPVATLGWLVFFGASVWGAPKVARLFATPAKVAVKHRDTRR
ncbi:MAG TPA: hypothetical protein VHO24_04695 [Opitutaceae bacterium]|nr:hypothetical protein [Opitutaceae bacterium]